MGEPNISNATIAELLAVKAETAKMPLQKALRRASRKAYLWPEEAAHLVEQNRVSHGTGRSRPITQQDRDGMDRTATTAAHSSSNQKVVFNSPASQRDTVE